MFLLAPQSGKIIQFLVEVGQDVAEGQTVFVLEYMKMQNDIPSPKTGQVAKIYFKPEDIVQRDQPVLLLTGITEDLPQSETQPMSTDDEVYPY